MVALVNELRKLKQNMKQNTPKNNETANSLATAVLECQAAVKACYACSAMLLSNGVDSKPARLMKEMFLSQNRMFALAEKLVDEDIIAENKSILNLGLGNLRPSLIKHLKLWRDEGIDAPNNELQSIQAWLACLGANGVQATSDRMRNRMLLLMKTANSLHNEGSDAEEAAGIYDNRPEMRPE